MPSIFQIAEYNEHGFNPATLDKRRLLDFLQGEISATFFTHHLVCMCMCMCWEGGAGLLCLCLNEVFG